MRGNDAPDRLGIAPYKFDPACLAAHPEFQGAQKFISKAFFSILFTTLNIGCGYNLKLIFILLTDGNNRFKLLDRQNNDFELCQSQHFRSDGRFQCRAHNR